MIRFSSSRPPRVARRSEMNLGTGLISAEVSATQASISRTCWSPRMLADCGHRMRQRWPGQESLCSPPSQQSRDRWSAGLRSGRSRVLLSAGVVMVVELQRAPGYRARSSDCPRSTTCSLVACSLGARTRASALSERAGQPWHLVRDDSRRRQDAALSRARRDGEDDLACVDLSSRSAVAR